MVVNPDAHKPAMPTAAFTIDKIILSEYNARSIRAPYLSASTSSDLLFFSLFRRSSSSNPLFSVSLSPIPYRLSLFLLVASLVGSFSIAIAISLWCIRAIGSRRRDPESSFSNPHPLTLAFSLFPIRTALAIHNSRSTNSMSIVDREHPSSV